MPDSTKPREHGIPQGMRKSSSVPNSQTLPSNPPRGKRYTQCLTYLLRRAPKAGGRCASSPASFSATASEPSWTPRGSYPQTQACVQNEEYINTDLQQKVIQSFLILTFDLGNAVLEQQYCGAVTVGLVHVSANNMDCAAGPDPLITRL